MNYRDLQSCAGVLLELLEGQTRQSAVRSTMEDAADFVAAAASREQFGMRLPMQRPTDEFTEPQSGMPGELHREIAIAAERILTSGERLTGQQKAEMRTEPVSAFLREGTIFQAGDMYKDPARTEYTMEAIDHFFRRDSRRYDNGFAEN